MNEFSIKGWKKAILNDCFKHLKEQRTIFSKATHLLIALVIW